MNKILRIFVALCFVSLCSCSTIYNKDDSWPNRGPSNTSGDIYQENGISRDQLYEELARKGRLENRERYSVIGLLESSDKAEWLYERGERAAYLDFSYPGRVPGLTSFWTVRLDGRYTCVKLSHVSPEAMAFVGPSEFWCIYP